MITGQRRSSRKVPLSVLLAVAGAAVAVAVALWAHWHYDSPVHHFGTVVPGVLYRSGQPRGPQWPLLVREYGIRTVIDLRKDYPKRDWQIEEQAFCRRAGLRYFKISIGPGRMAEEDLRDILRITADPACQPVLVHCEHGSSRTGVVVAAYRIVRCGWSLNAALAESRRYKRPMDAPYVSYLKELAGGEGWAPALTLKNPRR